MCKIHYALEREGKEQREEGREEEEKERSRDRDRFPTIRSC